MSNAEVDFEKVRHSTALKAGASWGTVGLKASVGFIEKPPDPCVMDIDISNAPARSGPLYDSLIPNCFSTSNCPKNGQSRWWTTAPPKIAASKQPEVRAAERLRHRNAFGGIWVVDGRQMQRWKGRGFEFVFEDRNLHSSWTERMRLGLCAMLS